jgi:hypothetical protein
VSAIAACGHGGAPAVVDARSTDAAVPDAPGAWVLPAGWRSEIIPFPLDFAPALPHHGVEELRFPPGSFTLGAANYWSYAWAWRLDDGADLDAAALGAELTAYYRGLLVAVDSQHRITSPDQIVAEATVASTPGAGFVITAHIFDAFNQAQPVDLTGSARRVSCGAGSLWVFEVSPPASTAIRADLEALDGSVRCGQVPVPAH